METKIAVNSEVPIDAQDVKKLYDHVGWWPERSVQDINQILQQGIAIGAWRDNRLIGFCRAITDGKFRAYVEDVCVHEQFRNHGIGQQLIELVLRELRSINVISLFCEEHHTEFYKHNKFKPSTQSVMHWKPKYGFASDSE